MSPETVCDFLILRHVDGDQVSLATVEGVGKRQRRLGLAHAAGTDEQEDADRPPGIGEIGAGGANSLADRLEGMRLADHPFLELVTKFEYGLDLVGHHLADRDPGPPGNDLGDGLRVDRHLHQRRLALKLVQCPRLRLQIGLHPGQLSGRLERLAVPGVLRAFVVVAGLDGLRELLDFLDVLFLFVPASLELGQLSPGLLQRLLQLVDPLLVGGAGGPLAFEDTDLHLEVIDLAAAVLDGRRNGVLADCHPGAGGIEQAD